MYQIYADEVQMGKHVVIEDGVVIQGRSTKQAKRIVLGDHVFIGRDSRAYVDEFVVGDYSIIHNNAFIAGDKPCRIGHCGWFGQNVIFNSTGGLTIGNGVGVGADSQLWSHIRHGDLLQGCRWNATKPLVLEDDVWLVGHCIVSPIRAARGSMAMVGSVVTRDMEANHVYAGVPAKDVTEKVGPQFGVTTPEEKFERMSAALTEFILQEGLTDQGSIRVVSSLKDSDGDEERVATIFDVETRTYNRRRTEDEFRFMRFLLSRLYKFYPR